MVSFKKMALTIASATLLIGTVTTNVHAEEEVNTVNTDTVFTNTEYYKDNPLGIAGNFHLVGFNSVKTGTHTNGNILTKTLYYNSNFGTNGLAGEVSYIQNIGNEISSFQFSGDSDKVIVVGKDVEVGTADNGNSWTLNGAKVDNPSRSSKPNSVMQDSDTVQFIDIDSVKAEMIGLNQTMAAYDDYGVTKDLSDQNNQSITIQNNATANVVNLMASDFNINNMLTVKGFEKGKNATLIINMDLAGTDSFSFAGSEIEYTDGTKASHGEVTQWQDGNIIWNFIDSSSSDGMYHGKLNNTRATAGLIIAPCATVDLTQNFNGTVIANDIIVSAESHRTDFTGKTIVPGGKDGEKPGETKETKVEKTEVEVTLEWDGEPAENETTAKLVKDEEVIETASLNEENNWSYTFEDLDKLDDSNNEIQYDVVMDEIDGYTQTKNSKTRKFSFRRVPAQAKETYTVTFTNEDGTEITSSGYEEGTTVTYPSTPSRDSEGNCSYTFDQWVFVEGTELGENGAVKGNATYKASFVKACKYTVTFKDYDNTVISSSEYNEGDQASYPENPTRDEDDQYSYEFAQWSFTEGSQLGENNTVTGDAVYTAEYTSTEKTLVPETPKESKPETTAINVVKKWVGDALDSTTVKLIGDGDILGTVELSAQNNWTYTWNDLPKYSETDAEHEITYAVIEDVPEGYSAEIVVDNETNFTITNTKITENTSEVTNNDPDPNKTTSLKVTKKWVGTPADKVTINLLEFGEKIDSVELSEENGWTYTFENLQATVDGVYPITYSVEEEPVEGYTTSMIYTPEEGFVITNTRIVEEETTENNGQNTSLVDSSKETKSETPVENKTSEETTEVKKSETPSHAIGYYTPVNTSDEKTPDTGDTPTWILSLGLLGLSSVVAGALYLRRKED